MPVAAQMSGMGVSRARWSLCGGFLFGVVGLLAEYGLSNSCGCFRERRGYVIARFQSFMPCCLAASGCLLDVGSVQPQGVQRLQKHRRILQVRYDVGKFALAAHGLDYVPEMFYLGFVRPEAVFACLVYILAESR